jgi:hypothetical protein
MIDEVEHFFGRQRRLSLDVPSDGRATIATECAKPFTDDAAVVGPAGLVAIVDFQQSETLRVHYGGNSVFCQITVRDGICVQ